MVVAAMRAIRNLTSFPDFRRQPLTAIRRAATWSLRRRLGRQQTMIVQGSRPLKVALPSIGWAWVRYVYPDRYPVDREAMWAHSQLGSGMVAMDIGAFLGS